MAWFTLDLTLEEAKALRAQLGDLPKGRSGPWILDLYRRLDTHLRLLADCVDDGRERLTVVRDTPQPPPVPAPPPRRKPVKPPPPPREITEATCTLCQGEGLVHGAICQSCRGMGEVA